MEKAAYTLANARPTTVNRMSLIVKGCFEAGKAAMDNGKKVDIAIFEHTVNSINKRYLTMGIVAKYLVDMFPQNGNVLAKLLLE